VRVLHLTSSFPRSSGDHVAPFLLDLARAQRCDGLDVAVLAPHDEGAPRSGDLHGIGVHRFRYAPARLERLAYRGGLLGRSRTPAGLALLPVFFAAFVLASVRLARHFKPHVLHAHWWLPAGVCGLVTSRLTGVPLVVTLHGTDAHLLRHGLLRRVGGAVLRRAALVVVVSEDLRRSVVDVLGLPPDRVQVLRMPVERVLPVSAGSTDGPLRLVAAGRLSEEKGFDVLLEALRLAVADGLDVELELVGSGPEHDRLAGLAADLNGRVRLTRPSPGPPCGSGWTPRRCWSIPSRREGLGLVALEAIARGRPVIASRVGGCRRPSGDGVDGPARHRRTPRALADALQRLPLGRPPVRAGPARTGRRGHRSRLAYERVLDR
jgi:glycosyltransferase involved in cell wall biosynthesis